MNFQIETTPAFDRAAKHLHKKYRRLKEDLSSLATLLSGNLFSSEQANITQAEIADLLTEIK